MTDDELHTLWVDGVSLGNIALKCRVTKDVIAGRIVRLRKREGEQRWPFRPSPVRRSRQHPHIPRAGAATLPPLPSLSE